MSRWWTMAVIAVAGSVLVAVDEAAVAAVRGLSMG
jgi:hypothetical protein